MKTVEELQAESETLQNQLAENRRETARAQAKQQRDNMRSRAVKNPVLQKAENEKDLLYARVFTTPDGQAVLADLAQNKPVLADAIQERIDRTKA